MLELYPLLIFMVLGALIAVETRSLLSAVVALGAVGFALCIVFFMLRAPEVAITQLTVEVLVLILLIRATGIKKDLTEIIGDLRQNLSVGVFIAFAIVFSFISTYALSKLPDFGHPLMTVSKLYVQKSLPATGAENIVSAILLDFRSYDTLGKLIIFFTAVLGVLTIMRKRGRKRIEEKDDADS